MNLDDIFKALGTGDKNAIAALYRETSPHIFAVLCRKLGDEQQAAFVMKEVYTLVWERRETATRVNTLNSLRALAHRRAVKHLVKHRPYKTNGSAAPNRIARTDRPASEDLKTTYLGLIQTSNGTQNSKGGST